MTFREQMESSGVRILNDDYIEWRGCYRKRRYSNLSDAEAAAQRTNHGVVYYCKHCFGFHLGHDNHNTKKEDM